MSQECLAGSPRAKAGKSSGQSQLAFTEVSQAMSRKKGWGLIKSCLHALAIL